jgi:GNAT superfamily N-acetyltransferase
MEMVVRAAEAGDAAEISALVEQLGYQRTPEQVAAWVAEAAPGASGRQAYVACLGAEIAGWVAVSIERPLQSADYALITGLVVKDGRRGNGIGRALCARAEGWAWQQGMRQVRVTSRSTRVDAHRFYLRDGYGELKTSLVFEKYGPE